VGSSTSGTSPFVLPTSMALGTYQLRLLAGDGVTLQAIGNTFTVGPPVTISGTATASGAVFAGVKFTASNGGTCTTSNSSGQYSCTVLQGWSGTVTPSFTNFTFTPALQNYTNVAANTTAQNYDASSSAQLSTSPTALAVGGTVTATWSNATTSGNHWLGLFAPGSGSALSTSSAPGTAASGSVPFVLPTSMAQGTYQLRLLAGDVTTLLAVGNTFTVGPPVTVSGTTTASGAVFAGVKFTASNGGTCTTSNSSGQYSCTVLQGWSGTVTPTFPNFTLTPASRDYTNVAANTTAQSYDASSSAQLSSSPTVVATGGTVTATWSNATTSGNHWLGLFAPGSSSALSTSSAPGTAASGSVPFVLPTSMAQGTYQLRLLAGDVTTLLAVGNSFAVGTPITISGTATASGAVFAGVNFTATNGGTCSASNSSGQYSCTVLQGWSGTITPTFAGFTMTPASRDYTNIAANTTAQNYDASSSAQLSAAPTAVAVGGTVTATWSNATTSGNHWLGLFAPGSSSALSTSSAPGTAASGSVPFVLPTSMAQGTPTSYGCSRATSPRCSRSATPSPWVLR